MLSALIRSEHSYPAVPWAGQLAHQRLSHLGPLVLKMTRLPLPAPTTDRDRTVSRRSEPSSRAALGGDRPSQTTRLALSAPWLTGGHETQTCARVVFHRCLPPARKPGFAGSHLCYASTHPSQGQGVVKLHGVFLSCRG